MLYVGAVSRMSPIASAVPAANIHALPGACRKSVSDSAAQANPASTSGQANNLNVSLPTASPRSARDMVFSQIAEGVGGVADGVLIEGTAHSAANLLTAGLDLGPPRSQPSS